MKRALRKNVIYALILAVTAFVCPSAQGAWTAGIQQKMFKVKKMVRAPKQNNPEDYGKFRDSLRSFVDPKNPKQGLFPDVSEWGSVQWHHVLGVSKTADRGQIRRKHAQLSRATHPDTTKPGEEGHDGVFQAVNEAKEEALNLPQNMTPETPDEVRYFQKVWQGEYDDVWEGDHEVFWNGSCVAPTGPGSYNRYTGSGAVDEVRDLREILKDSEITQLDSLKTLTAEWKKFYAKKLALYAGLAFGYKFLKKNKRVKRLAVRWAQFKKKHPKIASALQISGRGGFIALASIYPLYKFKNLFSMSSVDSKYGSNIIPGGTLSNEDLHVFYEKVEVGRTYHQNGSTPIYDQGVPIGYMQQDRVRKTFIPVRKAKAMSALTAAASLASAWLGCAL